MKNLTSYQEDMIRVLVESRALSFGEFTLKSGRISPYFFNMGRAISNGMYLATVSRCYCEKLIDCVGNDFTFIFGPAYKGIPLACAIAHTLWREFEVAVRWGYDRKEEKTYGDTRDAALVGKLCSKDKVIMVDDVITTGDTKIESWKKLLALDSTLIPKGVLVAVDREEKDKNGKMPVKILKEAGLDFFSILKASVIFDYLHDVKIDGKIIVNDDLYERYQDYRRRYN